MSPLSVHQNVEGGEEPLRVIAAVEPKDSRLALSDLFRSLIRENGVSYQVELFGSLPTRTTNYRPDLIPAAVIKEGYWDWMEWASSGGVDSWANLRDGVIRKAIDPGPLVPMGKLLSELARFAKHVPPRPEEIAAYLAAKEREGATLSTEDRRRILDLYFSQAYKESKEISSE